ncbi:MAG: SRPBCC family protein [Chloroflexi bacterium]|nr:SRPBCC family protein [Chloroflexota bacterium]
MQRVERRTTIEAPPDEVFAYLADLDRLAEWQSGVTEARRTSDGEMAVGATAHVTRQLMGQRIDAPLTVTAYEPPRHLAVGSEVSGVRADATLDVAPAATGSEVVFAMEIRGSMLTAFMEPMIASAAGGDIEASLERLRSRLEGRSEPA